ncbi:MAG TPA: ankyrin repeat domain-containing protein [Polyangiaceae bacterium]
MTTTSTSYVQAKSPELLALLEGVTEAYPSALESQYGRILEKIIELWKSNRTGDTWLYFDDLLIDKRGQRQGFPSEVAADIFMLSNAYGKYLRQSERRVTTEMEKALREIEDEYRRPFTPSEFYNAIEHNEFALASLFITAGMDVNTAAVSGMTPLAYACFHSATETALLLLENGSAADVSDRAKNTPLHWAAFNNLAEVCKKLLAKGVPVDAPTRFGRTPLFQAATRGQQNASLVLLNSGAKVDSVDHDGWSPLHKAVLNKRNNIVDLLVAHGADPMLKNKSGVTPLHMARDKGYLEVFRKLSASLDAKMGAGVSQG